jgi:hypothetical protein
MSVSVKFTLYPMESMDTVLRYIHKTGTFEQDSRLALA